MSIEVGQKVFLDFIYDVTINTLGDLKEHSCNSKMNLLYDDVFYSTIARENENEFNCSVPFHPLTTSKLTGSIIEICNTSESGLKAFKKFNSVWQSNAIGKNKPCAAMNIFMGLPSIDSRPTNPSKQAYIKLYMKSSVKVKSVIMYYDRSTFAAEIGGYVGMLMGMSVMDFTMMCNTVLFKFVTTKLNQKYQPTMPFVNEKH